MPRLLFLLLLALATPAFASDGVLEINQTCAVQTGCFAGDTAGFPVTIRGSGSYRLTSNLTVSDENMDAILVSESDVGIELNNFAIIGVVTCSGSPLVCTPALGTGSGVKGFTPTNRGISVKNGSITGMGWFGVLLGEQAEVTGLRVRWNREDGIFAGAGSTVSRNTAYQNGDDGITAGAGSTISGNAAYQNGDNGILAGNGTIVSGNSAYDNDGDGIEVGSGATVHRNSATENGAYGLNLGFLSSYRENTTTFNTIGPVNGGFNAGANVCDGAFCP